MERSSTVQSAMSHMDYKDSMTNTSPLRPPSFRRRQRQQISLGTQILSPPRSIHGRFAKPILPTGKLDVPRRPATVRTEKKFVSNERSPLQQSSISMKKNAVQNHQRKFNSFHSPHAAERSPRSKKAVEARELLRRNTLMNNYSARLANENEKLEREIVALEEKRIQLEMRARSDVQQRASSRTIHDLEQDDTSGLKLISGLDRLWASVVGMFESTATLLNDIKDDRPAPPIHRTHPYRSQNIRRYQAAYLKALSSTSHTTSFK